VDKNAYISVASMLASLQLAPQFPELVKKWANEVITLLQSK